MVVVQPRGVAMFILVGKYVHTLLQLARRFTFRFYEVCVEKNGLNF